MPVVTKNRTGRTEFGYHFTWNEKEGCWHGAVDKRVVVFPPSAISSEWKVVVTGTAEEYPYSGYEPEMRAFSKAARLIHKFNG